MTSSHCSAVPAGHRGGSHGSEVRQFGVGGVAQEGGETRVGRQLGVGGWGWGAGLGRHNRFERNRDLCGWREQRCG